MLARILIFACLAALAPFAALPHVATAQDIQPAGFFHLGDCPTMECPCEEEDDSLRSFGPCCCEVRKTLMQWSYGTSFSGGPPGMDEPLASDRPDFVEASVTVGRGVAQVEMGYTFISNDDPGIRTREHSYPEMLWRIGMFAEWFEFRIAYNHLSGSDLVAPLPIANFSGGEDLYLGCKLGLTPQEGILPEMALILQMTVPTGHADLTAGEVCPGFNWLYGWDINDFLSVGMSTQGNSAIDDVGDDYFEFAQAITINYALAEKLSAYTEWFALIPSGGTTAFTEHYADGGFVYRLTNNIQFDIRAGIGLSDRANDYFTGTGLCLRF